jgi:hypothetical protein
LIRTGLISWVPMATMSTMASVPAMQEDVEERTGEQQQQ